MKKCLFRKTVSIGFRAVFFGIFGVAVACAQIPHIGKPVAPRPTAQGSFADLTSAAVDPANSVCSRYAAGSTVTDPISLSSVNGTLEIYLSYQTTVDLSGLTRYCYVYTNASGVAYTDAFGNPEQAPTLHVNPGDTLLIHYTNDLPAADLSSPHMTMKMTPAASGTPADCSATSVDSSSSNMHFHGTTVAPVCGQDEVVHTIVPAQGEFDYTVQIPANEPPGLYWYHPHPHGYSDPQTIGGASGALIVDGVQNVNSATASLPARVLILRDQDLPSTDSGSDEPKTDLSLNYIPITYPAYTPAVLLTPPAEQEFWRVLNAAADTLLDLQVQVNGTPQPLQIISIDGVPVTNSSGTPVTNTVTDFVIASGARVEFVVTTPAAGATAQLVSLGHYNGGDGDADPARPLATINAVTGTTPPTALPAQTTPVQLVRNATPATINQRTLYFSVLPNFSAFYITENGATPTAFNMDNPPAITVQGGTVEQWTIENHSQMDHSFHIHQLHFQVVSSSNYPSGVPTPTAGPTLMDTIDIPYSPTGNPPYPSVTLLMDFRDPNIVGTFVYHCHILSHEDLGMMAAIQVTPGASTITATSSASTSPLGASVTLTANVAAASGVGIPTGTVTFSNGSTALGTATLDSTGTATLTSTSLPLGAASITAAYSGSTSFLVATSTAVPVTITAASTTTALTASAANPTFGSSVTLTATVAATAAEGGTPSGTVAFANGTTTLGTATLNTSGVATYTTTTLPVGAASITASYAGNTTYSASASNPAVVNVAGAPTTTTLTAAPASITLGNSTVLTATVATSTTGIGTPTGSVTFSSGTATLGTGTLSAAGVATYAATNLPVGAASITAAYAGAGSFASSTSTAAAVTVTAAPTTITLAVSPASLNVGGTVTCTATVAATPAAAGPPTGTVSFLSGTTTIATAMLTAGVATYTTTALPVGTASITAAYAGTTSFLASTSTASTVVITPPPTFIVAGSAVTIAPGATTGNTSTITVTPAYGFTGAVNLTAALTTSPAGASDPPTIALSPASVTISETTASTATATISSTGSSTSALAYPLTHRWYTAAGGAALAGLLFFGMPSRRRGWRTMLSLLVLLITIAGLGCGGSSGMGTTNPGTTAGAYTFTVTGTDAATGKVTVTGTINLTVN